MNISFYRERFDSASLRGMHIAITALLMLVSSATARAQAVGSSRGLPDSGGQHTIQGRVYLPSGRGAAEGIIVKLDGNVVGTRRGSTDADGSFLFNSLPAAEYTITVDAGAEYEVMRQSVVIYGANAGGIGVYTSGQKLMVDFHLVPKGSAAAEEKLFAGVPKDAVENYKKGVQSARAGNSKKAVEQLTAALAVHPKFVPALSELGDQYRALKEWDKLVDSMQELLKLKPDDSHAHLNLGIALYNQKKLADAEAELRESIKSNSADPIAHYYLGLTLVNKRSYTEAESELELTIKNGGDNLALAHKYLGGLYLSSKKNQQAADELDKYLKLEPKAADAERIKDTIKNLRSKQ
jgi:Tfp pilus assembly protein PilF